MQSILQYRRFRTILEKEIKRDRANLHLGSGSDKDGAPSDDSADTTEKDLERGDALPEHSSHLRNGDVSAQHPVARGPVPGQGSAIGTANENVNEKQREAQPQEPAEEREGPQSAVNHGQDHDIVEEEEEQDEEEEDENDDWELRNARTLSRTSTQQSRGTALGNALTGVQVRKRTTKEGGSGNVFVVNWQGPNDPQNPHNWSYTSRIGVTMLVAAIGAVVGIASSIDSSALKPAAKEFGVAEVVESMATGLFLVGFGAGSLFAGPLSETVGRNPVYIGTLAIYMIFIMASGLSPNIGAQLAFRFIAGCFAATPLTCAGGSLSDLWSPMERTFTFPVFANAAFAGPILGPVIGGWISSSPLISWRWVEWITLIISGLVTGLVVLFQPETYPPTLLKWKAKHLRDLTGEQRYKAEIEIREESFARRLSRALYRPFLLTLVEPIIILIALYLSVVYIILFTFLDGYDFIFTEIHGTSPGITGLCFLGIIVGLFGASALVPLIYKWAKQELERQKAKGNDAVAPEFRLWFSMLGGSFAIPISLFWMGWTSYPWISLWSPLAASVLFGYGILCVFISSYQYIIDSYETYAASALASVTLIRYVAAGGMTIVGIPFYQNMGVHYTLTILACLSIPLVPIPYVFYKFGPQIRARSRYAVTK